jgi:sugar (pentulose or hexulose) kinase
MMRAVYEGVVLAVRDLMQHLPRIDGEVLLTGGGAGSRIWTQMLADALGKTVAVPEGSEFGARGAALLAGTAIGVFPSVRDASVSTRAGSRAARTGSGQSVGLGSRIFRLCSAARQDPAQNRLTGFSGVVHTTDE